MIVKSFLCMILADENGCLLKVTHVSSVLGSEEWNRTWQLCTVPLSETTVRKVKQTLYFSPQERWETCNLKFSRLCFLVLRCSWGARQQKPGSLRNIVFLPALVPKRARDFMSDCLIAPRATPSAALSSRKNGQHGLPSFNDFLIRCLSLRLCSWHIHSPTSGFLFAQITKQERVVCPVCTGIRTQKHFSWRISIPEGKCIKTHKKIDKHRQEAEISCCVEASMTFGCISSGEVLPRRSITYEGQYSISSSRSCVPGGFILYGFCFRPCKQLINASSATSWHSWEVSSWARRSSAASSEDNIFTDLHYLEDSTRHESFPDVLKFSLPLMHSVCLTQTLCFLEFSNGTEWFGFVFVFLVSVHTWLKKLIPAQKPLSGWTSRADIIRFLRLIRDVINKFSVGFQDSICEIASAYSAKGSQFRSERGLLRRRFWLRLSSWKWILMSFRLCDVSLSGRFTLV